MASIASVIISNTWGSCDKFLKIFVSVILEGYYLLWKCACSYQILRGLLPYCVGWTENWVTICLLIAKFCVGALHHYKCKRSYVYNATCTGCSWPLTCFSFFNSTSHCLVIVTLARAAADCKTLLKDHLWFGPECFFLYLQLASN